MIPFNPEADALNSILQEHSPAIYDLLSEKGKRIFFPKKGLVRQGQDAKGKDINATIGMAIEDDCSPMRLQSIASSMDLTPEEAFPYAPSYGLPELRQRWQQLILEKNPSINGTISLPVVTCGLTHGLSVVGFLFLDPGDCIILPSMYWGNYKLVFEHTYDIKPTLFNTFKNGRFDTESLRTTLLETKGKQVLLLNFPHNPTGYTPTVEEAESIADIIHESASAGNHIATIHDDAYFGLVYEDGIYRESLFSKLAHLHENVLAIKIDGATKEDYAWGFRVGFITYAYKGMDEPVCQALESKTAGRIRGNISNAPRISQSYILKAICSPEYKTEKRKKYELLKSRFDRVKKVLKDNEQRYASYFKPLPFNSGYFMCLELAEGLEAEAIRQTLLNRYSTGIIALESVIRIAFSSAAEKDIPRLFENIYNVCREMKSS